MQDGPPQATMKGMHITGRVRSTLGVQLDRHGTSEIATGSAVGPSRDNRDPNGQCGWTVTGRVRSTLGV